MSKLKIIDAKTMEKLLISTGFIKTRQKGSHGMFKHNDGRKTTVPYHPGKDLARPLIRQIITEIRITVDEYNDMLKKL